MASDLLPRIHLPIHSTQQKSSASHLLHARQSEGDTDVSFGGSTGAIALYVVFGIIVVAIVFTTFFRSHRARYAFASRPPGSVYQNQPTPWNPSSFSHHRGTSQSSRGDVRHNPTGTNDAWTGRMLNRLTPRGRDNTERGSAGPGNNNISYHSTWPSAARGDRGNTLPFSSRDEWAANKPTLHVAVPPAYHKIVADKPPEFQGAPPEYYEEIDLEAQRVGQGNARGSSSREPNIPTGAVSSRQQDVLRTERESQDADNMTASLSVRPAPEGQSDSPAAPK